MVKRQIIFSIFLVLLFLFLIANAKADTLNLKAIWTAPTTNTDGTPCTDLASYKVYRIDVPRVMMCTIQHPALTCNLSITVPDGSAGVLQFVATAVDTNNNESADSNTASYSYNLDSIAPVHPGDLKIEKQ